MEKLILHKQPFRVQNYSIVRCSKQHERECKTIAQDLNCQTSDVVDALLDFAIKHTELQLEKERNGLAEVVNEQ